MKKTVGTRALHSEVPLATMHLEGKHALQLSKHKVGAKASLLVKGTKQSHYQNADGSHSVGFKIDKVELHTNQNDLSGPDDKSSNNQRDGGKVA